MSEKCVCYAQSTFSPKCTFISCGIFRSKIEPALQKACEIKYFNTQNLCTYFENMIVLNKCRETRHLTKKNIHFVRDEKTELILFHAKVSSDVDDERHLHVNSIKMFTTRVTIGVCTTRTELV